MGIPKLSSGVACFLLWLFVVRSVQVCVLANTIGQQEKSRKTEEPGSTTSSATVPLQSISTKGTQRGTTHDGKSASYDITADKAGSKVDQNRAPVEDHIDHIEEESAKNLKGDMGKGSGAATGLVSDGLQQVAATQQEQQHKNDGGQSDSRKKSSVSTVDSSNVDKDDGVKGPAPKVMADEQNAANNLQKIETSKNIGKKHLENNLESPVSGSQPQGNPKVEETTAATTPKVTASAQTSTRGTKPLPTQPPQGQGQQKDTDASSGQLKDLGGMPPASNPGNLEYGNAREPDSEEELEPPLPTQKGLASVASGSASLGAQPIVGSMGGSHPEKPLDASGAAGSMPSLPSQDDSHFFAYFLTAVVLCVVGYLAFHNKRKILALILEGRHERQRRHNGHYRRLDNTDEALSARKSRGSF
ncbi:trans-Golgi network integral membrane protein TGN38 [Rhipicephalus sanguineus]|uniref:trans-Golgi network integral membrane protein TGN38 n=1 Tax=Rhipicephalus sanguineus TaxID=34632 RepID=UPI0018945903|nr:trans-Golgi network integral membrane protein TGN38 [Rhipicephalus sanguineus]